jgi:hypothetical protein
MTLNDIWLNQHGGDFATGVELLKKHNPTAVTSRILQRFQEVSFTGATPNGYERGKLAGALQKTAAPVNGIDLKKPIRITPPEPSEQEEVRTTVKPASTTEAAKRLHKEHAHVHAQMVMSQTDTDRADHARKIMETIVPSLDEEYDKLREGTTEAAPPKQDATKTLRQLQSVRTRIARLRNVLIPKEQDKKRLAQLEKELAEKIIQKEKLESEL